MKSYSKVFCTVLLTFCFNQSLQAQEPKIISEKINENTYILFGGRGLGANVGLSVGQDGILLIDSMNASSSEKLLAAIRVISDKPIRYILNTHGHADHVGGNQFFANLGAVIISHENTQYFDAISDIKVSDGFSLEFNDETFSAHYMIGHSDSDLAIHLANSDILFLGDTFTNTWHPTATGAGLKSELDATELAIELSSTETVVVPGHGILDNLYGLERNKQLAKAWFKRVGQLVRNKVELDAMASDPELNRLRKVFVEKSDRFETIPESMFKRFIERTLSSDYVAPFPMREADLQLYVGSYRTKADENIKVIERNGALIVSMIGMFTEEIIPLSESVFHIRSSLGGRYEFALNSKGEVDSILRIAGEDRLEGVRITP